jgi:dATP pyrophosphohydrolase
MALSCPTVPEIRPAHVEVYVFRRRRRRVELLTLRRSPGRSLAGVWQPVTGGVKRGEGAFAAARREVQEETGLRPKRWWALQSVTVYFDPGRDSVRILPLFAAEIGADSRVRLSHEHDRHAFLTPSAAGKRYLWDAQRSALAALRHEVLSGGPTAAAREIRHLMPSPRRGGAKSH